MERELSQQRKQLHRAPKSGWSVQGKKGPSAAGVRLEQRRSRSHRVWLAIVRI